MDLNCCELTLARILLLVLILYQIHNLTTCIPLKNVFFRMFPFQVDKLQM